MNLPKYALSSSEKMMTFEFASEGEKGIIHKLVKYQETNLKDLYNLAFGDKDVEKLMIKSFPIMEIVIKF